VFQKNETGGYTVTVPALPGLVTEGDSLESARSMVLDAITCYLEGLSKAKSDIPQENEYAQMRVAVQI
jgi:predicted RNase H-like HicB family nuclease